VSSDGAWTALGCGRRDCEGCYRRRRWEIVTALFVDAQWELPDLVLTLTTHDPAHSESGEVVNRAVQRVFEWLRRRYGREVAYLSLVEFTTGRARRSGGYRRLHLHVLVKLRGAAFDLADVEAGVSRIWAHNTGATVVEVSGLQSCGGIIGYLGGLHHTKRSQRPPDGWEGRTLRASRNYWHAGREATYSAARAEQADRRRRWRAEQLLGDDATPELVALEVAAMEVEQAQQVWRVAPIAQWVDQAGELHVEPLDEDTYSDQRQHRRRNRLRGRDDARNHVRTGAALRGARRSGAPSPAAASPLTAGQPGRTLDAAAGRTGAGAHGAAEDAATCRPVLPVRLRRAGGGERDSDCFQLPKSHPDRDRE
jgi:hypothetical protein